MVNQKQKYTNIIDLGKRKKFAKIFSQTRKKAA